MLTRELGYCPCACDDAVPVLADILQLAGDRADSTADDAAFARASRAIEERLALEAAPGIASWFVYTLEQRDLIWHGFRLTDIWITDKGRALLEALRRYHPQAHENADIERRLQQDGAREALSWLREEPPMYRSVSGQEPPAALALVESLYAAGARRVVALDIVADEDDGEPFEYTHTLVIEQPEEGAARARIFAICAAVAHYDEPVPERGRRYVLLWWNNGRPVVC